MRAIHIPAPQGRLLNSLGFQPQAGGGRRAWAGIVAPARAGIVAPADLRLGLKPQAREYSPLRGEVKP